LDSDSVFSVEGVLMMKYPTERGRTLSICTMGSLRARENKIVTPDEYNLPLQGRFDTILCECNEFVVVIFFIYGIVRALLLHICW
jgi:hypothetical protein